MKSIHENVSSLFYTHGLLCASHPFAIISLVICIAIFICSPLVNIPLPGNAPLKYSMPLEGYKVPADAPNSFQSAPRLPKLQEKQPKQEKQAKHKTKVNSSQAPPRWYFGHPIAYVQQIIVRGVVSPWQPDHMTHTDTLRVPLQHAFDIRDHLNNFQFKDGDKLVTMDDLCMHVAETIRAKEVKGLVPQYGCLILSPGGIWNHDRLRFGGDGHLLKTIHQTWGQVTESPFPLRDILFGVPWKDTGLSRLYMRTGQRPVSFAVTIMLKEYNPRFVNALRERLKTLYPLSADANLTSQESLVHVYYRDIHYFVEYTPLLVTYIVLFLYIYFSVRKIELVKSKWGLALSAVMTVISSLLMSVSICLLFGLTPSLNGSEIFPYLVVIIGLENVLVLTKSVVSTPVDLDVKLRVAQGLSKEGWPIFKNLMAELLILAVGFFTFVPAIQEFCLFAVVGLLSDFFLQMYFFTTVLSIDIRRMELADLHRQTIHEALQQGSDQTFNFPPVPPTRCPFMARIMGEGPLPTPTLPPPAHPPLPDSMALGVDMQMFNDAIPSPHKMPRRVKLLNFWARTRVMQRAIMVCVVIWITLLVYKTGLVEHLTQPYPFTAAPHDLPTPQKDPPPSPKSPTHQPHPPPASHTIPTAHNYSDGPGSSPLNEMNEEDARDIHQRALKLVHHEDLELWERLSHSHWPTLLGYYNMSLNGRYITMLPSIGVSMVIPAEDAINMRHPEEAQTAMDMTRRSWHGARTHPNTRLELFITVALALVSMILLLYLALLLYRCFCPRNYPKWRASWSKTANAKSKDRKNGGTTYFKQIRESVPLVLPGHMQEVDCIATNGQLIVSCCLGGQLRVWDSTTGECMNTINRHCRGGHRGEINREPAPSSTADDSDSDLYAELDDLTSARSPSPPISKRQGSHRRNRSYGGHSALQLGSLQEEDNPFHPSDSVTSGTRSRGVSFEDVSPDLSDTIQTNFCALNVSPSTKCVPQRSSPSSSSSSHAISEHSSSVCNTHASDTSTIGSRRRNIHSSIECDQVQPPSPDAGGDVSGREGYDFSEFATLYEAHHELVRERMHYEEEKKRHAHQLQLVALRREWEEARHRSKSTGDFPSMEHAEESSGPPTVWCLDCSDNLIITGCGNGRIEVWDGLSGQLKCVHQQSKEPVTAITIVGNRVIAARLCGSVDFLELESFVNLHRSTMSSSPNTCGPIHNRVLLHTGSSGDGSAWEDAVHCSLLMTVRAHQHPITMLQAAGGRVVTGSQDHTLKVFRLEDSLCLYTLHGHNGSITTLHLDKAAPLAAASGSEDGSVRLWDLMTGACVHKLHGHNDPVTSLTCTSAYIISAGMDDRLCLWERCKGILLHWIQMESGYLNCMAMLTSNLMITGGQGCLYLWDISKGEVLRAVSLGDEDHSVFVRQVHAIGNAVVVCDYGNQLRVIHFPAVLEKSD